MGRFVCSKCGAPLTHRMFPYWNAGWFCPKHGKVATKLLVRDTRAHVGRYVR